MSYTIKLIPKNEIETIVPLLQTLNDTISVETLHERLEDMLAKNYECVRVYDSEKLIGISGIWLLNKYYVGKHIEPDNVIIHPDYRSKDIGEMMM